MTALLLVLEPPGLELDLSLSIVVVATAAAVVGVVVVAAAAATTKPLVAARGLTFVFKCSPLSLPQFVGCVSTCFRLLHENRPDLCSVLSKVRTADLFLSGRGRLPCVV